MLDAGQCGVLPTTGSHGSCSESSREFLPVRLVFPDAVATSASSTKRRLYGAKRSLYRGERCVDSGANRATIVTARPTKAGRSAGGANAAVHSSGKPRVDDEARGSPPAGRRYMQPAEKLAKTSRPRTACDRCNKANCR